ncbi:MAG: UDP-glucose/GDP-mannose dehydrogenase family protein [Myxococcota bacterium]|jgi:UDPglucose 6-dehydrogenase
MNIAVIGTGYVGLVTGACFSEFGVHVTCVDNDEKKIKALDRGEIPIYEAGLEELVARNVKGGRLQFTSDAEAAIDQALVVFIAVGTPEGPDGSTDLRYVEAVAREIGQRMTSYKVIVAKSTVPVGTSGRVRACIDEELARRGKVISYSLASNPEFLREGAAIGDFMRPDRVVIGTDGEDDQALAIMKDLYRPLYLNETPFVETDIHTAELSKYAANAFLATKISFINEMSVLCEAVGGDVQAIARVMGLDNRIGKKFLHAGPGFGGSCFPKDTKSVAHFARDLGHELAIVEASIKANERQRLRMVDRVVAMLGGDVEGKTVGMLGLSFKPETDDIREAPALDIASELIKRGATVRAYDPAAMEASQKVLPELICCEDAYDALTGADVMTIVTEWNEFRMLDLTRAKEVMAAPRMVDMRNIYDGASMAAAGFEYKGVGV